jgi:monofunctional biosynthetic peptidoglycan transglycosylase
VAASVLAVVAFRWIDPPTSSVMIQHGITQAVPQYRWVPWEQIAPSVPIAVVAAEDQRFPTHRGFDVGAIRTALDENRRRAHKRGASTITQQVAKNLFLWSGRTWLRKAFEAYFTVLIELTWPKRRILEVYLNVAQLGEHVFGVGVASAVYFGKPAARITPHEAALLAAALPNPRARRPDRPTPSVQARASWIAAQVRQLGGPSYLSSLD